MTKILVYKCDICGSLHEDKCSYVEHLKNHIAERKYNKLSSHSLLKIKETVNNLNKLIVENPANLIGESGAILLAYCLREASEYNPSNICIDQFNKIKNCKIDRVDIKKTSDRICIIARIDHAAEKQKISSIRSSVGSVHFENIKCADMDWSNYSRRVKDSINMVFKYTDSSEEYKNLEKLWYKLLSKAKLKSDAKKLTKNTFRVLN